MADKGLIEDRGANQGPGDRDLIARARSGDREALAELLRGYTARLTRLARRRLASGRMGLGTLGASDLVQDTAERAVRSFQLFQGVTDPEMYAWLAAILTNVCIGHRRHSGRRKRAALLVPLDGEVPSRGPSASECLGQAQAWRTILAEIFALPEPQGQAVYQHLRGVSLEEIALSLQRSKAAVSCLINRGQARLRERLGHDLDTLRALLDAA